MSITVRYFASIRERLGTDAETFELLDIVPPTVGRLYQIIGAEDVWMQKVQGHLRCAVNHEFVGWDHPVADGDEVALIPPVSGGVGPISSDDERFVMTTDALDPSAVRGLVSGLDRGAIVTFEGTVRDHTGDRDVSYLEYDAYPEMALKKLSEVAAEAQEKFPGVSVAIHHRWGRLELGESAVCTAVSHAHRRLAYEASAFVIDRLKEVVPIWKKEVSPNGEEWIGQGP